MWAKLDDKFHCHHKTQAVSLSASGLYARALSWTMDMLTGGFVPSTQMSSLAGKDANIVEAVVDELVAVGTLEPAERGAAMGWTIHDIHDYNPTPAKVRKLRKERANAGRIGGKRSSSKKQASACDLPAGCLDGVSSKRQAKPNPAPAPAPSPKEDPAEAAGRPSWVTPYLERYGEALNERRAERGDPPLSGALLHEERDIKALCQYLKKLKDRPTVEAFGFRVDQWLADAWQADNGLTRLRDFPGWHQRQVRKSKPVGKSDADRAMEEA